LHGMVLAMYIAGQERRLVDPPSQVVAGVRTVTTTMNGRGTLPRCRACSLFINDIHSIFKSKNIGVRYNHWSFSDEDRRDCPWNSDSILGAEKLDCRIKRKVICLNLRKS